MSYYTICKDIKSIINQQQINAVDQGPSDCPYKLWRLIYKFGDEKFKDIFPVEANNYMAYAYKNVLGPTTGYAACKVITETFLRPSLAKYKDLKAYEH